MIADVPPAAPTAGGSGMELPPVERLIPLRRASLWQPAIVSDKVPSPGAYPVFITRRALEALNKLTASPGARGVFGFLVGDLCHCPRSGILYVEVDSLVALARPEPDDQTPAVIGRAWTTLQQRLGEFRRHLLGWYHSPHSRRLVLAPGDLEAHFAYFRLSWQVALVVGVGEDQPEAAFFRPVAGAKTSDVPLPFFEIVDARVLTVEGRGRSCVRWRNYRIRQPTIEQPSMDDASTSGLSLDALPATGASSALAPAATAPPARDAVSPEARDTEAVRWPPLLWPPDVATPPAAPPSRRRRALVTVAAGLATAAALFLIGRAVFGPSATSNPLVGVSAAESTSEPPGPGPVLAPELAAFGALGDSLAADVRRYRDRAARFAARLTDCQDLATAFATLEGRWIAYSLRRQKLYRQLDSTLAAADGSFYSAIDTLEASYERSGCPRP